MFYRLNAEGFEGLLMRLAHRQNESVTSLVEARERLSAFTISDMAAAGLAQTPPHLGPISGRLWELTYALFVGGTVISTPAPFQAKSVLLARATMDGGDKQNFLTVGGVDGHPLLVAFPHIPEILLSEQGQFATFGESVDALEQAASAMIDRVNTLVPAARALLLRAC